jgi:hypothetical protein
MSSRSRRTSMAAALTACFLILGSAAVPAAATVQADPVGPPAAADLTEEQRASLRARTTGEPVEVASMLTESTRVVANPDGSFSAEVHAGPVRFREDEDAAWRQVDLELIERADGSVAPKGHPRGLVLSGKAGEGDHDLARLTSGEARIAVGWSGPLPRPELDGTTATYRDVRPGIDLVVDATRTGFEELLVVRERSAARHVETVSMPWRTAGVVPVNTAGGGLRLQKPDGTYVGHVPPLLMWDAAVGAVSGERLNEAPVAMKVRSGTTTSARSLVLTPQQSFLDDPRTQYPVTIDPSPTLKPGYDAFVQDNIQTDRSTSKELKLGRVTDDGRTFRARSFIRWPTGAFARKRVTKATMYLWNTHSWNCEPRAWHVWITGAVGTSTNWDNQPKWFTERPRVSSDMTKGYSGCTSGYITANVQSLFAFGAANGFTQLSTGLRVTDNEEDNPDSKSWKKFESSEASHDPYVSLTYNSDPAPPTDLRIGGKACGSSDPAAYVSKAAGYPAAQARVSDPDGTERPLTVQFFIAKRGTAGPPVPTMSQTATSGTVATKTIPAAFGLIENQAYSMQARTFDGLDYSTSSAVCSFTIDSTGPQAAPTVTSADYPECTPTACVTAGGVGKSGRFTFGARGVPDITQYRYWFDGGAKISAAAPSMGAGVTVSIDPPPYGSGLKLADLTREGVRRLHVVSVDQAGRESPEYTFGTGDNSTAGYLMQVGAAPEAAAWWKLDDAGDVPVVADASPNGRDLTLAGTRGSADGDGDGGRSFAFGPQGAATGDVVADLLGSRTTTASILMPAFSGSEATVVRHVRLGDPYRQDDLYVDPSARRVCYRVRVGQTTTPNPPVRGEWKACSAQVLTAGVWARVAGGFDAMRREAFVYVNGVRTSSTAIASFTATTTGGTGGNTVIANGALAGSVDNVRVYNRLVQPQEIGALAVAETGRWDLDRSGDDTSAHPDDHPLHAVNPPDDLWTDVGHVETGLGSARLSGNASLSTTGGVMRTDQSFSVSAWVSLKAFPTRNLTVASQDGTYQSNFFLGVRLYGGVPRWSFSMENADSTSTVAFTHVYSADAIVADDTGAWVHVVGVYDATAQQQQLYVNGVPATPAARTARWHAAGPFNIGRGLYSAVGGSPNPTDYFQGEVDDVRVYAGVLGADMINRLYTTEDGQL